LPRFSSPSLPADLDPSITLGFVGSEASFTCVDNSACDTNPTVGVIDIPSMIVDGLEGSDIVVQSTGNQDNDNPAPPSLSFSVGLFRNATSGNLDANFAVSDTDFRGSANLDLSANASWTNAGDSNVILGWFADPNNTQGGNTPTDAPGMNLDDTEFEPPGAAASESMTVLSESSLYSLSDQGTLFLVSGGTASGGQSTTFSSISPAVPEPSTWAMMALGFAELAFAGYRRARLRPASV
jgi:PEP-CTERM motif